jgi:tRNA G18 (ribose-2'-O)-methylase SpoU
MAERLPVARVTNIVALLKSLQSRNIWVAGLDPAGATPSQGEDYLEALATIVVDSLEEPPPPV